jgi:endonuclease G
MPTEEDRRLESLRGRLTPAMREAIAARMAGGGLPPTLAGDLSPGVVERVSRDAGALESSVRVGALEAIVLLVGRPPLLVRNNEVELEDLPDLPPGTDLRIKAVSPLTASVGRIEFVNAGATWGGTGWVIDRRADGHVIATNRHVAQEVARRLASGKAIFLRAPGGAPMGAEIDFGEEVGSRAGDESRTARLTTIHYLADDFAADVALFLLPRAAFALPDPIPLAARPARRGDRVALIGYPAYDSRNAAAPQARYFRDLYEVKRFAPGLVTQEQEQDSEAVLSHDCTSLGGNSGSPLIELEHGTAVGLHFAGLYGQYNSAVSAETLKGLLSGTLVAGTAFAGTPEGSVGAERADGHHPAEFFRGRKGFSTRFLLADSGRVVETPWPGIEPSLAAGLAKPSDRPREPRELRYQHFGVKYSGALKVPLMTAVNIDGGRSVRIKRGRDQWFTDGRIPREVQLGSANFADELIDRGHMVRREDPNWGQPAIAERANYDTFHYVNAAAQHGLLNKGKTLWQGLENYILDSGRTHGFRLCVFTGPVIGDEDETIDGAPVPMEFWKLVATLDTENQALSATAYLLSQGQMIRKLVQDRRRTEGLEGARLGEFRTFQLAISDLGAATGHDFSAYVDADPLKRPSTESLESAAPRVVPLDTLGDIRL